MKAKWDKEYLRGDWDYLHSEFELARYALIASYCEHLKPGGRILDAGCGEGLLYSRLHLTPPYHGVDFSEAAVSKARARHGNLFSCQDLHNFESDHTFDVLVLNEVLYYLDSGRVFEKLAPFLSHNALVIISIFQWDAEIQGKHFSERENAMLEVASRFITTRFVTQLNIAESTHAKAQQGEKPRKWKIYLADWRSQDEKS